MTKKEISTAAIEDYNNKATKLASTITEVFTDVINTTKKVDAIIKECELPNRSDLYVSPTKQPDLYSKLNATTAGEITQRMEGSISKIKTNLSEALDKAQKNDKTIKNKLTERSSEIKQLKNIISQYKNQVSKASSISSPGLASGLRGIGSKHGIDKISGVVEGRNKKMENQIKNDLKGKKISPAEMEKLIKDKYKHLNNEELATLKEYYLFMMEKNFANYHGIPSESKDTTAKLVVVNGKYQIIYANNKKATKFDFFTGNFSAGTSLAGAKVSTDNSWGVSGPSASVGAKGSIATIKEQSGSKFSVGNVNTNASVSSQGVSVSAGATAMSVGKDFKMYEDDLYIYNLSVSVNVLAAQVGGKLALDGISVKTPGLVGISLSGGKIELININVDI